MTELLIPVPRRPISVTKGQFGFKVRPARLTVNPGLGLSPDFRLLNRSGQEVRVTFPPHLVVDGKTGEPICEPFTMADKADRDLAVNLEYLPPKLEASEVYSYEVFMTRSEIEASGSSRPDVEIQR